MRVLKGLHALRRPPRRAIVTIGVFDGVHIAHQRLIRTAVRLAKQQHGTSVVMTFTPDPVQVLDPQHAQPPLMSLEDRVRIIRGFEVDWLWVIAFTQRFSQLTPERFVQHILLKRLRARWVVVGRDFAFGNDQRGNLDVLRAMGNPCGMRVMAIPPVLRGGKPISSSRIRQLIQAGDLATAHRLLGRPLALSGVVVRGTGRARQLGYPTANVQLNQSQLLPPHGVYRVWLECAGRRFPGLMNLGTRPTFGPGPLVCEVHLMGFSGSLYGKPVTLAVLSRLRAERRFESPGQLAHQIREDLAKAHLIRFPS